MTIEAKIDEYIEENIPTKQEITVFRNKGLLDLDCIRTFGINVKECDNPIGQFGTGLKYAIAVLLRHGINVEMFIDGGRYKFQERHEPVRGKEFGFVYMNDEKLAFTTDLGKHWELWMAFRELYSNTIDEGGFCDIMEDWNIEPSWGQTMFCIESEEFAEIAREKGKIFLESEEPVIKHRNLEIHAGASNVAFNKGIRVAEFEKPAMNTYNLQYATLTEDRTLYGTHQVMDPLLECTVQSDDPGFIEKILTASQDFLESDLNFSKFAVREGIASTVFWKSLKKTIKKGRDKVNPTALRLYDSVRQSMAKMRQSETVSYTVTFAKPANIEDDEIILKLENVIEDHYDVEAKVRRSN